MLIRRILIWLAGGYLSVLLTMMTLETRLVYPARDPQLEDWTATDLDHREFEATSSDGTAVHGWVLPSKKPGPAIVVFHGNAEDVAEVAPLIGDSLRRSFNATVLVFDFRGYGKTSGVPSEERIIEDGVAAVRKFADQLGVSPDQLVFYGRSLGGGVALGVAAKTGFGALILDRTFNRLTDAASANYPLIPAPLVMRNQFDSASRIALLNVPLLQSHFVNDEIVPVFLGERLFAASPSQEKQFLRLDGGGHLEDLPESWWPIADDFLRKHAPVVGVWSE